MGIHSRPSSGLAVVSVLMMFNLMNIKTLILLLSIDGSSRKLPINGRQHISPNGTLHIAKVNKKEDEGSYECEVQQESGLVAKTKVHLKVISKFLLIEMVLKIV